MSVSTGLCSNRMMSSVHWPNETEFLLLDGEMELGARRGNGTRSP